MIKEKLDRTLANGEWNSKYANAKLMHIENHAFDHYILLLDDNPKTKRTKRGFFFDAR